MTKREKMMAQFAANAKEADRRNDVTARKQASNDWRELATSREAKAAPDYITWAGR